MTSKARALGKPAVMLGGHLSRWTAETFAICPHGKKMEASGQQPAPARQPRGLHRRQALPTQWLQPNQSSSLAEPSSSTVQIPDPQKPCEKCLLCQATEFGVVLCTALDNEHRWSGSEHDPRDPGRLHFTGAGGPSPTWLQGVSLGTGVGTFFCHWGPGLRR